MAVYENLRRVAINRHRKRIFGDDSLNAYSTTPALGETLEATFAADWFARRVETTTNTVGADAGAWQFQIVAADDWETSQAFMLKIVALAVGVRRWKAKKVEKPIGNSKVWKIKAEIQ